MFCYRRFGHNEGDEPAFTQPVMYKAIAKHPTTRKLYGDRLIEEGMLDQAGVDGFVSQFRDRLEEDFEAAQTYKPNKADWLEGAWTGMEVAKGDDRKGDTAVELAVLREIAEKITSVPDSFKLNAKIARQFQAKLKAIDEGKGIDWATAEALAFGACAIEGTPVRLSGQDCGRGTFSQRHAVLTDQETAEDYVPLQNLREDQAKVDILDSPLAEMSVLGFEYGYTTAEPNALVMWEAQFGDFANGAQVVIDQFITAGELKWLRMSGVTMLLPHGYEGQGPEHSSARLERYLQMCAEDNMQVCVPSTPANYFHMLRRQVRRNFRKPLIVMTPKSLLRHKACVSELQEFGPGSAFRRVIPDQTKLVAGSKVKRVVLCSGKVYYDLLAEQEKRGTKDQALIRIEQLYPFPEKKVSALIAKNKKARFVWAQEEPENMGPWPFLSSRHADLFSSFDLAARPLSASPAVGSSKKHIDEYNELMGKIFK